MTTELTLLFWSLAVYTLYLGAQSLIYRAHYGVLFAATARDAPPPEGALLGRAERALKNFLETWPAFIILTLVAHLADPGDPLVFWGAVVWYVGRIVYLPLYLFGVVYVRSLVWCVAATGLFLMFIAVLF
ncbi:MAG: MAPEG family protein [Devosia sp.]|nr:MAPEG family protein [Devosia sp.]